MSQKTMNGKVSALLKGHKNLFGTQTIVFNQIQTTDLSANAISLGSTDLSSVLHNLNLVTSNNNLNIDKLDVSLNLATANILTLDTSVNNINQNINTLDASVNILDKQQIQW